MEMPILLPDPLPSLIIKSPPQKPSDFCARKGLVHDILTTLIYMYSAYFSSKNKYQYVKNNSSSNLIIKFYFK